MVDYHPTTGTIFRFLQNERGVVQEADVVLEIDQIVRVQFPVRVWGICPPDCRKHLTLNRTIYGEPRISSVEVWMFGRDLTG